MKPHLLLVALVASLAAAAAMAGSTTTDVDTGIQRCDAGDGTAIYTDKGCHAMDARPAPMSGELLTRLAKTGAAAVGAVDVDVYRDASETMPVRTKVRRPAAAGCARSPQQLSTDLRGSFALHDVNRVAESYHWVGMSHRQAMPVMKQLARLSAAPLSDARFLAAWIGPGDMDADEVPADAGLMQLVFAGDARVVDFEVRRYAGCYFISF